jgi:tRNA pseudouridine38-40 synthase
VAAGPVSVVCAGRTDAGVHAAWQVVHFDTDAPRPEHAFVLGTNTLLPPDVSVLWCARVDASFHARFSARWRRYRYHVLIRDSRPCRLTDRVAW